MSFKVPAGISEHAENDLNVPFVSGSARFDAMVIVPCSMATLGRIASGSSDSALLRAADVFLKERRKLILVPRETPWSLIHARNVVTLLEAGAIVLPAIPSFYSRPASVDDVVDTVVWRILDQIGLPNPRAYRWADEARIPRQKLKIEGWRARWLIAFGYRLLKIWASTLRYEFEDRGDFVNRPLTRALHRLALAQSPSAHLLSRLKNFVPHRPGAGLISASRDGDLVADLIERFGFEVVRGSSSRKGASAMLAARERSRLRHGRRSSRRMARAVRFIELGQGIIFLAQKTGRRGSPINMEYSSCWRLKSWDRFILPRPFSKCA